MAQKQYSFDFVLNAVLNGGFSGTFTKAQQEFIRLGNEIKNLQAIQRDVKAYEKQDAAVKNSAAKLENLEKQYALVKQQISETTGSTTALEREKLRLEQRIANTSNALEKQNERLKDTKERLEEAGVSTDDLAGKDDALTEKIKELTEEQKKAAEGAGEFGSAGVQAIEAVGGAIAAAGIAEAVKGIADAYEECVGVAGDFEQVMSAVEAIADANNREMAALKAEAKELGATTIYTAKQSGKGMEFMAMAGWKATEMLSGMKGMTTLAAAAGEDMAQVSDIVTDNLTAFGLTAADTAHFADVLAAAAANSNTNISIMGDTFKNSSSVAGALGYSIEDVAVMVGLMANNAVKGSRAGTALRNIFNGLLGGVTLTGKAFGELEYSAVNTDGSMKGLMETVEDLRGYFDQMTEAERVNNAMTIAGMRGYNGLLAILKATDEDFQSLYNSVNNCTGAAERMASVKLDNLAGDITIANSAMEALQATIGEQFTPELRELTQLKTELLNGLNLFIQENPELAKGIMVGAGAFGALATAIVGVNAAIKVYRTLKAAEIFAASTPVFLAGAGALAVLVAGVYSAIDAQNEMVSAYTEVLDAHRDAEKTYQDSIAAIDDEANATYSLIAQLRELSDQSEKTEADQAKIANIVDRLNSTIPELNLSYDKETDTLKGLSESVDDYVESLYAAQKAKRDVARAVDLVGSIEETEAALADAREELDYLNQQYEGLVSSGGELGGTIITIDKYRVTVKKLEDQLAAEKAEYDALTQSTEDYYDAQNKAGQATDNAGAAIADARARIQKLAGAYKEAYGTRWNLMSSRIYSFIGYFSDGKLNGPGIKFYPSGQKYFEGDYEDGYGVTGKFYYEDGTLMYEGGLQNDKYSGTGTLYWENGTVRYNGEWSEGKRQGNGTSYREDGTKIYEGDWTGDTYSGYGKQYFEDGVTIYYEGRWASGKKNGNGTEYYKNGNNRFEGTWQNGTLNGKAKWYWENGALYYDGEYKDGIMSGSGSLYSDQNVLEYYGNIEKGERNGIGESYRLDGETLLYSGEWANDLPSGQGMEFDETGAILHEGTFENGAFVE